MASNILQGGRGRGKGSKAAHVQSKGRSSGVPNYQTNILLNIIEAVLPVGSLMWQTVASRYHEASKEPNLRDFNDVKRKFGELHKHGKAQPTGTKTVKDSQARALRIYRSILQKESCVSIGADDDDFAGGDEVEEEVIDDDFNGNGGEDDDGVEDNNNLNDSFDSSYQHDDDAEQLNLDDAAEYEAGEDHDGIPLPKRMRKSPASNVSSSSTTSVVSSVKTKNSRPSGGQKPSSGRGSAASAMHAMVEVMRDSNLYRQQQDLNRQQLDMMKFAMEQQKTSAAENTALRAQVAGMQTQMQQIMLMLQEQQKRQQSSSSSADPEATQMLDA